MERLRTILIEDEPLVLQSQSALIQKYCPNVEIIGTAQDLSSGKKLIEQSNPDLVLMDIQLAEGTSFELLKSLHQLDFEIIFITAFSQYAIKAIKFNALDYLLKPVDVDDLKEAIKRAIYHRSQKSTNLRLQSFLNNTSSSDHQKIITLHTSETLEFVKVDQIIRCKAEGAYTNFHTVENKTIIVSKNIKTYENLLEGNNFFRPHQSHLINKMHIKKYFKNDGGYILMSDNSKIPVSKYKRSDFLKWIQRNL